MSDPKSQTDVRPYAVRDALEPASLPRVVIHTSPSAAVSHVVGARFTAVALNAMEVLSLNAQGVQVEDPRNTLPKPQAELTLTPTSVGAPIPADLVPCPPEARDTIVAALNQPSRTDDCKRRIQAALDRGDVLTALDLAGPDAGLSEAEVTAVSP